MKILTLAALLFCLVFGVRANVSAARPSQPTKLAVDVTINTYLANSTTPIPGAQYTVERCLELAGKHCAQWSKVIQSVSTSFPSFVFGADAHTRYRITVTHRFMYCESSCSKVIDTGTEPITLTYFFTPGEHAN